MRFLAIIIACLINSAAFAHQLSTAYLNAQIDKQALVTGTLHLRLFDLARSLGLDNNNDDHLSWREVTHQRALIGEYIQDNFKITRAGLPCSLNLPEPWMADEHFNEGYLVIPVQAQCSLGGALGVGYTAFFTQDSSHKLIIQLNSPTQQYTRVITSDQPDILLNLQDSAFAASFKTFIYQGMVHIWQGLDHIVFLLSLLITCVLIRENGRWQANPNKLEILRNAAWLVSAFTLAHSITLSLTALNIVQLPSRWVEVFIAVSVAFAAVNNVVEMVKKIRLLTLLFGLVHGMGFAGVLSEIGVPADNQLPSILAFNIGVEIGQAVLVLGMLPILFYLRNLRWYRVYGVWGISGVISCLAIFWVSQRI